VRTVDDSIALIDTIVGRCVRDHDFARKVMEDPETALAEYRLNSGELDDFIALKAQMGGTALEVWEALRELAFRRPVDADANDRAT
jgi:hypothetical protein